MRLFVAGADRKAFPESIKRVVLLPIPTSRDKVHLSGTDKLLCEVFGEMREGDLVAGYGIDKAAKTKMRACGAIVYDALEDEAFLAENAHQTALGALGYILSNIDTVPSDTDFAVIGYGRIGSQIVRMLLFLGGKVEVFSTSKTTCLALGECGVSVRLIDRSAPLVKTDASVIINTAPTDLSASFADGKLPSGVRVIELASGENFAKISGIERLPRIPDKYYAKSAGRAYYNSIINYMSEVTKK